LPPLATRRLIAAFVTRAVVDLETRDVELELSLPEWAVNGENAMCLDGSLSQKSDIEAHPASEAVVWVSLLIWCGKQSSYGAIDYRLVA
jgi:hypothetical protein